MKYVLLVVALGWMLCAQAQEAADSVAPEEASAQATNTVVKAQEWMVSAANPYAVEAGAAALEAGGSAVDALVAVQLVLGLTEPQSSGIGGGAFLVYWDAETEAITTFDGRETAPQAATPQLFQNDSGEPLGFWDAVVGGRSVGTPGTLKLLHDVHGRYGVLPWADVVQPAIDLASHGFTVSARLATLVANDSERLGRYDTTRTYFFDDEGNPIQEGDTLTNPDYAAVLQAVAEQGSDAFYTGEIAQAIVDGVQGVEDNPGLLGLEDLALYQVKERPAVCVTYRDVYDVCGMGPPSSGALTVGQILGTVGHYDLSSLGPDNPEAWRIIGDASRLAFADRGRYMADSDFVPMPTAGLVDVEYLASRAALLEGDMALESDAVVAGEPAWAHARLFGEDVSLEFPSTSHISIIDGDGNITSMTTTIENGFGSRLMVRGFLLNNELTDFSFRTHSDGVPIANRVEPGKRPRSSMSPSIVLKDGAPYMVIGSPGGSRIIGYVAKTIIAHIDWGLDIQQAISSPHLVNRFGTYDLEAGSAAEVLANGLVALGYEVNNRDLTSGLHGIVITEEGLEGGADPRREGIVIGQ